MIISEAYIIKIMKGGKFMKLQSKGVVFAIIGMIVLIGVASLTYYLSQHTTSNKNNSPLNSEEQPTKDKKTNEMVLESIELTSDQKILIKDSGAETKINIIGRNADGSEANLADAKVNFTSMDTDIAKVDEHGVVTPIDIGTVQISVIVTLHGKTVTSGITFGVPERELTVEDLTLDGEYGSLDSHFEKIGVNHFKFYRGVNRFDSTRSNLMQFVIESNLKGNHLIIDIQGLSAPSKGHNMHMAYSYDNDQWTPILQEAFEEGGTTVSRITMEPSSHDQLYFGWSIPFSHEKNLQLFEKWSTDTETADYTTIEKLGESYQGREIFKMIITDANSDIPEEDRWVHYVTQEHPHEGKSNWRGVGLVEWLLSDDPEAKSARERSIWHVILNLNPDGVANGFLRHVYGDYPLISTNDPNRAYQTLGSDPDKQVKEIYLLQNDLEQLMASDTPITALWDFHVWGDRVEPIMRLGNEYIKGNPDYIGSYTVLRDMMEENDPDDLIKPLAANGQGKMSNPTIDSGFSYQFGVTSVLVEGGGLLDTQDENKESGAIMAKSIMQFYRDTKSTIEPWPE